jgi:replication factor C subunit 3/5
MNNNINKKKIWIEKYRPKRFEEIIGQEKNINILQNLLKNKSLPHLLFHGNSGVGKTSTINAITDYLYGKNKMFMVMKLDASDDRGINSVRDEIKGFAEKMTINNKGVKIIILDEADSMTFDAQFALRRIIEKYSDNTRFCLICNYENKIIKPIKSRCVDIRFYPIKETIIEDKLKNICTLENIKYTSSGLKTIAKISNGDMRKAINTLQSLHSSSDIIKSSICYNTLAIPTPKTIKKIYNYLFDKNYTFNKIYTFIKKKIIDEGISISLFLKEFYNYIIENTNDIIDKVGNKEFIRFTTELSDLENKSIISTFSDIYIIGFISIFKKK